MSLQIIKRSSVADTIPACFSVLVPTATFNLALFVFALDLNELMTHL